MNKWKNELAGELSRFKVAYSTGLERDVEPISLLAVQQAVQLLQAESLRIDRDVLTELLNDAWSMVEEYSTRTQVAHVASEAEAVAQRLKRMIDRLSSSATKPEEGQG